MSSVTSLAIFMESFQAHVQDAADTVPKPDYHDQMPIGWSEDGGRFSVVVGILQVALHREVLPETVQAQGADIGSVAHPREAGPGGEGNRARPSQHLGGVIEEDFVHDSGTQR